MYNGPRIVFNYLDCPNCKQRMSCSTNPALKKELMKQTVFEEGVIKKALERAKFEDLHKHERVTDPKSNFYGKLKEFAMSKLSYYMCFKCQNPYFGGMKDCDAAN